MEQSPRFRSESIVLAGRYHVRKKLGSGSFGTVYLAESMPDGSMVALKLIRAEALSDPGIESLQKEFRAIADLRHPQIASAYDFGYAEEGRLPFYTREYVDGVPLRPGPPGPEGQAEPGRFLAPILDLLEALEYLHDHGILHLDIHAGNLIEASDPRRGGVLIDFGIPRQGGLASTGLLAGRGGGAGRRSPTGEAPGTAAEILSVGRLLLYRLTGDYRGEARLPREIPGWGARLTLDLERIISKAVHPDPAHRFASARELRETLVAALGCCGERPGSVEPRELTMGRDGEISLLEEGVRRAASGSASALWLFGPLGVGKTRLLTEARWRAQIRGLSVVDVRFLPGGGSPPAEQQILRSFRGQSARPLAWLESLSSRRGGSSADRARRAADAYFSEPGAPLALLVDDLAHADRESRLLVEALVSRSLHGSSRAPTARGLSIVVTSEKPPGRSVVPPEHREAVRSVSPLGRIAAARLLSALARPLAIPQSQLRRLLARAGGKPSRIRQLARFLHAELRGGRRSSRDLSAVRWAPETTDPTRHPLYKREAYRQILELLAAFGRPCRREEISAGAGLLPARAALVTRLEKEELVSAWSQGRRRVYYLSHPAAAEAILRGVPRPKMRSMHLRAADYLRGLREADPARRAALALHLVAGGKQAEGRSIALGTVPRLIDSGRLDAAVRLLESVSAGERVPRFRRILAEEISEIHALAGDHTEGAAVLEPLVRGELGRLEAREAVRIRRRLGIHYHRSGQMQKALRILSAARRLADTRRDWQELVYVLAELAEYHTFRAEYEAAESLCREGLRVLQETADGRSKFRGAMEVTLRASLGHLELRRMRLEPSLKELRAALSLAKSTSRPAERAAILNNLGIVHNELNRYRSASRCFRQAEALLAASGEQRAMIQTACNLSMISAKLGDEDAAIQHIERARRLLRGHPGQRLEFIVGVTGGSARHLLGRTAEAMDELARSLPLGRKLGDEYLVRFGEIYLAEAHALCGKYWRARRLLRGTLAAATRSGQAILRRMAGTRLLSVERILGRERASRRLEQALDLVPRTSITLLEAWNDLIGSAAAPGGEEASQGLESARRVFDRLSIPLGARLARVALLRRAVERCEIHRVRGLLVELERQGKTSHHLLRAIEPLAEGEAALLLGETERALQHHEEAAAAIVGVPLPEVEWRIDLLRARIADRQGDRDLAGHHLQRACQTRELLVRQLPERFQEEFKGHPRFSDLEELAKKAARSAATPSTPLRPGDTCFGELVGGAPAMRKLYETVDRLRGVELPVLITGETGVGKELVARAVHRTSPRKDGPFYALRCASLPPQLFESELFGYEAGAFTGAEESRPGLLEHLRGGTLLLDEITELSRETQTKLLQVIDTKVVRPLGSLEPRPVDVRFLASTREDAAESVREGALGADLYYRLRAVEIHVPPLRERREDIPLLVRQLLRRHAQKLNRSPPTLSQAALRRLGEHDWPGNVRELESLVERLLIERGAGAVVDAGDVRALLGPLKARSLFPPDLLAGRDIEDLRRELDRAYLERVFQESGGRIPEILDALRIRRSTLYAWMRRVGLDVKDLRGLL